MKQYAMSTDKSNNFGEMINDRVKIQPSQSTTLNVTFDKEPMVNSQ